MERINRIDPAELAALKRLSVAITFSLLLHAAVVPYGPGQPGGKEVTGEAAHFMPPRIAVLSLSLQRGSSTPEAPPGGSPTSGRSPASVTGASAPDARYYPVEELDVFPTPRNPIVLPQATPASGTVRLLARIDAAGRVNEVSIFDSGAGATDGAAAIDAMRRSSFFAARKQGRPVRSEVVIELAGGSGRD